MFRPWFILALNDVVWNNCFYPSYPSIHLSIFMVLANSVNLDNNAEALLIDAVLLEHKWAKGFENWRV